MVIAKRMKREGSKRGCLVYVRTVARGGGQHVENGRMVPHRSDGGVRAAAAARAWRDIEQAHTQRLFFGSAWLTWWRVTQAHLHAPGTLHTHCDKHCDEKGRGSGVRAAAEAARAGRERGCTPIVFVV